MEKKIYICYLDSISKKGKETCVDFPKLLILFSISRTYILYFWMIFEGNDKLRLRFITLFHVSTLVDHNWVW